MSNSKTHNSIIFLTTLGVYLGLVLVGAVNTAFSQGDVVLNKRSLRDFAGSVQQRVLSKEVDLNAPFLIELTGVLDKKGKLDLSTAKYTRSEGDAKIVEIAKRAVEAINDAGYLQYLSSLSANRIILVVKQGEAEFEASISSELESEQRARTVVSAMSMMLELAKAQRIQNPESEPDKDDVILLRSATVSSESKNFTIHFSLPKAVFREMLESKIAKQADNH